MKKIQLRILIASGLFIILLLVLSIIVVSRQNPYGPSIKISGLDRISGLPRDEKNLLEAELYKLVERNLPENSIVPTSGASVVANSISYPTNDSIDDRNYHAARFLVELKSLKMSFVASAEWTRSRNKSSLSGYPVSLTCPVLVSENLYPETPCSDFISASLGSSLPLLRYLPYRTDDLILSPVDLTSEKPEIEAVLLVHSWQTPYENLDQKVAELKQSVTDYILSVGASPEDYNLAYKIEYGD